MLKIFNKAVEFLRDAKAEVKRVTWPTRKELFASTFVVILCVLLISFFLWVVDLALANIIKTIL